MKQILENFNTGKCTVEEVPAPIVTDGFVLVRSEYSLISSGTEGGTVRLGKKTLLGKARARPEQVKKVVQVAKTQGLLTAYRAARRSLEMPVALGYCVSGTVIAVGRGVDDISVGDRVACGGAGYANHAELVSVPKNLVVGVGDGVAPRQACFATLGAIAMQSLRVARVGLGDKVVVIGLGLVGLLAVQVLRAAGCKVFGIDIDARRVKLAEDRQFCSGASLGQSNLAEVVRAFSAGQGVDAAIITASSDDNGPVALAGELVRNKARVVVVGRTKLSAPRESYLFKELELCTSMAYGPGTGDPGYEYDGVDYPIGYVRWTERRNMAAVVDLIGQGKLDTDALVTHEFPIDRGDEAFDLISGKDRQVSIAVLLNYPKSVLSGQQDIPVARAASRHSNTSPDTLGVLVIGAGSYASNEFLPLLCKQNGLRLQAIASANGVRAKSLAKKYGFASCVSDPQAFFSDPDIDCVFILTRHDSHAELASLALQAGKHVFVEKPLALNEGELNRVVTAQQEHDSLLMVGFNRRYAPLAVRMKDFFGRRAQPVNLLYRANVGYRPPDHWLHHPLQGGGVVLGEACHHIDFCNWLVGFRAVDVTCRHIGDSSSGIIGEDNAHISLTYADGSLAHIAYVSNGCKAYSNERVEMFCDGKTATLTDFDRLELASGLRTRRSRAWLGRDKGHAAEIADFLLAARGRRPQPLDIGSYFASSRIAIEAAAAVSGATHA